MLKYPVVLENLIEKLLLDNSTLFAKIENEEKKIDIVISALIWAMSEFAFRNARDYLVECGKNYTARKDKFHFETSFGLAENENIESILKDINREMLNSYIFYVDKDREASTEDYEKGCIAYSEAAYKEKYKKEVDILNKDAIYTTNQTMEGLVDFFDCQHPAISVIAPYLLSAFIFNNKYREYRKNGDSFYSLKEKMGNAVKYSVFMPNRNRDIDSMIKQYFDYPNLRIISKINLNTYLPKVEEIFKKYAALLVFIRFFEKMKNFNFTLTALLFEKKTGLFSLCLNPSMTKMLFPYNFTSNSCDNGESVTLEEKNTMLSLYDNIINDDDLCKKLFQAINELDIFHDDFATFFCNSNFPSKIEVVDRFFPAYKRYAFYSSPLIKNMDTGHRAKVESIWWSKSLNHIERIHLNRLNDNNNDKQRMIEEAHYLGDDF